MPTRSYDLNISRTSKEGLREFYEEVTESWKSWKEKPKNSDIRLGGLGEPTGHPEYPEVLKIVKPTVIITDGRIIGTPRDPRQLDILKSTLDSGAKIILRWSDTPHYRGCLRELLKSKAEVIIGVPGEISVREFRDKIKCSGRKYIIIPGIDINDTPVTSEDLKDEENLS